MLIEEIENQLRKGKNIEDVLEKYDWKKFESVIAEIFQENGFHTRQNFRFKTKRRYEIDVIAVKNNKIFCIDCKWWGRGRYKKTGFRQAIISQEGRVKELQKFLRKNPIACNLLKIMPCYMMHPLLVTLHEEDIIKERDTFLVPAWKLNNFVVDMHNYF